MSCLRDTAAAIAQRSPGNFVGVVLYIPTGGRSTSPWWSTSTFPWARGLEEWYAEIAPSHTLFYYIAAFDKTRSTLPVAESTKPGQLGFDIHATDRWRYSPYRKTMVAGEVSQAPILGDVRGSRAGDLAKTIAIFTAIALPVGILLSRAQERAQVREEKAAFRRLGLDWEQRSRYP